MNNKCLSLLCLFSTLNVLNIYGPLLVSQSSVAFREAIQKLEKADHEMMECAKLSMYTPYQSENENTKLSLEYDVRIKQAISDLNFATTDLVNAHPIFIKVNEESQSKSIEADVRLAIEGRTRLEHVRSGLLYIIDKYIE